MHGVGNSAFGLPGHVDCRPGEGEGRGRVDTACGEEGSCVGEAWSAFGVCVGQEDDVPDYGEGGGPDDEDGPFVELFGVDGYGEGGYEGECVGGDGEELGFGGCVAEVFDDGWLGGVG